MASSKGIYCITRVHWLLWIYQLQSCMAQTQQSNIYNYNPCQVRPVKGESVVVVKKQKGKGVKKRVGSINLSQLHLSECVSVDNIPASPEGVPEWAQDLSPNAPQPPPLEIQFMPNMPSMYFELQNVDLSISESLIGNGISGRQVMPVMSADLRSGATRSRNSDQPLVGEINMLVRDQDGITIGSAHTADALYHFYQFADGTSHVSEIKLKDMPKEIAPQQRASDPDSVLNAQQMNGTTRHLKGQTPSLQQEVVVDIMVAYTKRSFCGLLNGDGLTTMSCDSKDAKAKVLMQSHIELAVFESNQAFVNSGVAGKFRLVHTLMVDETYDELIDNSFPVTLTKLSMQDGVIDEVLNKREEYGADMVLMLIDNPEKCGLAFKGYPVSQKWTYAVVYWQCATGYYSFVHELMHLMGAGHDRDAEGCDALTGKCCLDPTQDKFCTSFGYQHPENKFRTIMAYDCPVEDSCPRLQMFSQADVTVNMYNNETGKTEDYYIGNEWIDNVQQIKMSWQTVAAYRAPYDQVILNQPVEESPSDASNSLTHAPIVSPINSSNSRPKSPTMIPTMQPTHAPSFKPKKAPTDKQSKSPTRLPTKHPTNLPTVAPTKIPVDSPTKLPTRTPTRLPTKVPTNRPTNNPTLFPTKVPTKSPTSNPTQLPVNSPTKLPTRTPTRLPTKDPTNKPTNNPTLLPTKVPTKSPTINPTQLPVDSPTQLPTKVPSNRPTSNPTRLPTKVPTLLPIKTPTRLPTEFPSNRPTINPTQLPVDSPTQLPTKVPSNRPTSNPTRLPTQVPTLLPTKTPTQLPTEVPTLSPTSNPTRLPTKVPTNQPSNNPTQLPVKSYTKAPTNAPIELPVEAQINPPTEVSTPPDSSSQAETNPTPQFPAPSQASSPIKAPTASPIATRMCQDIISCQFLRMCQHLRQCQR